MGHFNNHRKNRSFGPIVLFCLVCALIWWGGFIAFTGLVPRHLDDTTTETDGIVVLTGGTERLNAGLTLLSQHKAKMLLISGVYHGVDLEEILSMSKRAPKELECCVHIGHEADSTRGNAKETMAWIQMMNFQSIRLVTANYHMPRSLLEFSYLMPYTHIIAHPVFPDHVKVDQWWRWPGTAALLIGEYNKYLLVWVRQKLAKLTDFEFLK
jgi:uncharacterized SAM-binding protein YcdF (DUF218 family)